MLSTSKITNIIPHPFTVTSAPAYINTVNIMKSPASETILAAFSAQVLNGYQIATYNSPGRASKKQSIDTAIPLSTVTINNA